MMVNKLGNWISMFVFVTITLENLEIVNYNKKKRRHCIKGEEDTLEFLSKC